VIEPTDYHQFAVPFAVDDRLVLYTDALIEARDERGRMLGEQGLLERARGLEGLSHNEFRTALVDAAFAAATDPPDDDVTLLSLRGTGSTTREISLGERLEAIRRLLLA
jgi:serine phosphatase RsbU (regulator of sigma subunit)